jgi:hypothetical protein
VVAAVAPIDLALHAMFAQVAKPVIHAVLDQLQ